jgi:hypothetical protein
MIDDHRLMAPLEPNRMSEAICPACDAPFPGGQAACQSLFDELFPPGGGLVIAIPRDLAFDAYCMQHLEPYCRSAKSYAAHLTRLCCGLEYDGQPQVYAAIQRWLNGSVTLQKPVPLANLGFLTIADIGAGASAEERTALARIWVESVWQAYTPQHALARRWVQMALGEKT